MSQYDDYLKTSIGVSATPTQDPLITKVKEVPGDLGALGQSEEMANLAVQAIQQSRGLNIPSQTNCRFRGPRESNKFQLVAQALLWLAAQVKLTMQPIEAEIETKLLNQYPTDDDLASIQHAIAQLKFLEYLKLRSTKIRWFE